MNDKVSTLHTGTYHDDIDVGSVLDNFEVSGRPILKVSAM